MAASITNKETVAIYSILALDKSQARTTVEDFPDLDMETLPEVQDNVPKDKQDHLLSESEDEEGVGLVHTARFFVW